MEGVKTSLRVACSGHCYSVLSWTWIRKMFFFAYGPRDPWWGSALRVPPVDAPPIWSLGSEDPGGAPRPRACMQAPPTQPRCPAGFSKIVVRGRPPTSVPRENRPAPHAPFFFLYYASILKILKFL